MQLTKTVCKVRTHKNPKEFIPLVGKPLSEADKIFAVRCNFKSLTATDTLLSSSTTKPKFIF